MVGLDARDSSSFVVHSVCVDCVFLSNWSVRYYLANTLGTMYEDRLIPPAFDDS